jgi:hypothetical protein
LIDFRLQRIAPGGIVLESHFQIIQRDSFELGGAAGLLKFGTGGVQAVRVRDFGIALKRRFSGYTGRWFLRFTIMS